MKKCWERWKKKISFVLSVSMMLTVLYVPEIVKAEEIMVLDEEIIEEVGTPVMDPVKSGNDELLDFILDDFGEAFTESESFSEKEGSGLEIREWCWDTDYPQLKEKEGEWKLILSSQPEGGYAADVCTMLLPAGLKAKVDGCSGEQDVEIERWSCEKYVQDENGCWPLSGKYVFEAELEAGYFSVRNIEVTVELNWEESSEVIGETLPELKLSESLKFETELITEEAIMEERSESSSETIIEEESKSSGFSVAEDLGELETDSESEMLSESETEKGAEPETSDEPETEMDSESEMLSESETEMDSESEMLSESETEMDSESEMLSESETETDSVSEKSSELGTEMESATEEWMSEEVSEESSREPYTEFMTDEEFMSQEETEEETWKVEPETELMSETMLMQVEEVQEKASDETSGICGENLSWSYENSTLTIYGSGRMSDYSEENPAPWNAWRNEIVWVVLEDGVTGIGSCAFSSFTAAESLQIPGSVESIGTYAIYDWPLLRELAFPDQMGKLAEYAVVGCPALEKVTVLNGAMIFGKKSVGYNQKLELLLSCVLYGHRNSTAESYAANNWLDFVCIDEEETQDTEKETDNVTETEPSTEEEAPARPGEPGHIDSAEKLLAIYNNLSGDYVLTEDIDLSEGFEIPENSIFRGTLDGQGHTITGLSISSEGRDMVGLFGIIEGVVQNLNIKEARITASGALENMGVGILGGNLYHGSISNCTVSGSVEVTTGTGPMYMSLGGLVGGVNEGRIDLCTVEVDITASNTGNILAGGITSIQSGGLISGSSYNGTISLTQDGEDESSGYIATGIANSSDQGEYSTGCTVDGVLEVRTQNGLGRGYGLWGASNSVTNAEVNVESSSGIVGAWGAYVGNNLTNTGAITATVSDNSSNGAYAAGISDVTVGENQGAVLTSTLNSYSRAQGLDNCADCSNSGTVTAISATGEAQAFGALGAVANIRNTGAIFAEGGSGTVYACGISGSEQGKNCTNTGRIKAITAENAGEVKLMGAGIIHCSYSTNEAEVALEYNSTTTGSTVGVGASGTVVTNKGYVSVKVNDSATLANAWGIKEGEACINYGNVFALGNSGNAQARGVGVDTKDSENYGTVTAHSYGPFESDSGNATAYGAAGANCYNTADVVAIAERGTARAYGVSKTGSVSTGLASATATYYKIETPSPGQEYGVFTKAYALNSLSTRIVGGGYDCTVSNGEGANAYYLIPNNNCPTHRGSQAGFVTYNASVSVDGCHLLCGKAQSMAEGEYSGKIPEPESEEEPEPEVKVCTMELHENYGETGAGITKFDYACGSFLFHKKGGSKIKDSSTTDYSKVYAKVAVDASKISDSVTEAELLITLPDGLSFFEDAVVTQKRFFLGTLKGYQTIWLEDPIYLLYSEEHFGSEYLEFQWEISGNEMTEPVSGSRKLIKLNNINKQKNVADIRSDYSDPDTGLPDTQHTSFIWDGSVFDGDSRNYNRKLAELAAYFSEMMEEGVNQETHDKRKLEIRLSENLEQLGFSRIEYGGASDGFMEEYVFATKKVVNAQQEVKTAVIFALQGSDSLEDWLGNLFYVGGESIHVNFLACSLRNYTYFEKYCKKWDLSLWDDMNRILLTGHSRGGAIANCIAARMDMRRIVGGNLDDSIEGAKKGMKNLYCYTYAAPNTNSLNITISTPLGDQSWYLKDASTFGNIFNVVNYTDMVPFVPGDLDKFGISKVFNFGDTSCENMIAMARTLSLNTLFSASRVTSLIAMATRYKSIDLNHRTRNYVNAVKATDYAGFTDFGIATDKLDEIREDIENSDQMFDILTRIFGKNPAMYLLINGARTAVKLSICCPVDIEIRDVSGNVVCRIINNEIVECTVDDISILIRGVEKHIGLPDLSKYTVNIIGYEEGTMDYSLITMDEEGNDITAYNFTDIEVRKGEVTTAKMPSSIAADASYALTNATGTAIMPDEILTGDGLYSIEVSLDTNQESAVVAGSGIYSRGDYVSAVAYSMNGAVFEGWYDQNGNLVSTEQWHGFQAESSVSLTARFGNSTDEEGNTGDEGDDGNCEISMFNLRGDGYSWIYTDEDLDIVENVENLAGKNYTLQWSVGYVSEDGESFIDLNDEGLERYSMTEYENRITLHGNRMLEGAGKLQPGDRFEVRVAVYVNGKEKALEKIEFELREGGFQYQYPEWNALLPGQTISVGAWRTIGCQIENSQNPLGVFWNAQVTDMQIKILEGASDAISIEPWSSGDGWTIMGNSPGRAAVTLTYQPISGSENEVSGTYTCEIEVGDIAYNIEVVSDTGINQFLPGRTLELYAVTELTCVEENGWIDGSTEDVTVRWSCETVDWEKIIYMETDPDNSKKITVTALPGTSGKSVLLRADAYIPGNGEELYKVASQTFPVCISESYYILNLNLSEENAKKIPCLKQGDSITFTPELKHISSKVPEGECAEGEVRYRFGMNESIEVRDGTDTQISWDTPSGAVPFILKKVLNWDTNVEVVAEIPNGNGDYYEVAKVILKFVYVSESADQEETEETEHTEHVWDDGTETKQATCTESGVKVYTCIACNEIRTEEMPALGHDWDNGTEIKKVTCIETGEKQFICKRCKDTKLEILPKLDHNYSSTWVTDIPAMCTKKGERSHHCIVCGDRKDITAIEPTGHSWNAGTVTTAATCTAAGVKTYTCTRCNTTRTETIAATGHSMTHHAAVAATCTAGGRIEYWSCSRCGKNFSDAAGTREAAILTTAALGHSWNAGVVTTAATCTAAGVKTYTCTRCKGTKTEAIAAAGHKYSTAWTVDKAATCTTAGEQSHHCTVCGAKKDVTAIAALGHSWNAGVVTTAATCTAAGVKTYTCTRCKETKTEAIAAAGHKYSTAWTVDKAATCTEAGQKSHHCTVCGSQSDITAIAALGHKYGKWVTTKEATVLKTGTQTRTCSVCKKKETKTIAKLKKTIKLNVTSLPLKVKQSTTAVKVVTMSKGDSIASWSSSNKKIATVTSKGKITGKKAGKATITVKLKSGAKATVKITVQKTNVLTTKVTVPSKKVSLKKGKSTTLKPIVTPLTSTDKLTYKSSNTKVATVSKTGKITAKKKGTAKITVTSGKKKVTVTVTVK